jgi:hypothetical protein
MKFVEPRRFADPDVTAGKLVSGCRNVSNFLTRQRAPTLNLRFATVTHD